MSTICGVLLRHWTNQDLRYRPMHGLPATAANSNCSLVRAILWL